MPGTFTITNNSDGAEAAGSVTLCAGPDPAVAATCAANGLPAQSLRLVPACGSTIGPDCPAGQQDPGVFTLSAMGTGEAGTACAGVAFTISVVNAATGQVAFVPASTIVLGPPSGAAGSNVCRIDFTFSVNRVPTHPLGGSGSRTEQLGFAAGFSNVTGNPGTGTGTNTVTINQATVPVTTQVSPTTVPLGGTFTDTATLTPPAGAAPPTGTVTFNVYAPSDPTCAAAVPDQTSTVPLNAAGTSATSGPFTARAAGTYRVIAIYSGDANYVSTRSSCGDATEAVTVTQGSVPVTTQVAPSTVPLGGTFTDTATLGAPPAGAPAPTGTVTFNVYAPSDPMCAAAVPNQT
ncbi:MAG: Ig-like domain repeat protein, partial [Actinobacteria bacterium]|nr:Ig-like domain repeat protein [Actinomycetota bacterium]